MPEIQSSSRGLHVVCDDMRAPWATGGLPVVCHHGIGITHQIWAGWLGALAPRHPVWRFDMRGFGRSARLPETGADLDLMIADLMSVVDQTGAEKVHLIGESFGGTVALAAALRHPERVASVQISNASYKGIGLGELHNWSRQFEDGGASGWSRRMMDNRFHPELDMSDALAWFEMVQAQTDPRAAIVLGAVLSGLDLSADLPSLRVPLSVVLPDSSPFVPVAHGEALARLSVLVQLRIVPDCRHGLVFSHAADEANRWLTFARAAEATE